MATKKTIKVEQVALIKQDYETKIENAKTKVNKYNTSGTLTRTSKLADEYVIPSSVRITSMTFSEGSTIFLYDEE